MLILEESAIEAGRDKGIPIDIAPKAIQNSISDPPVSGCTTRRLNRRQTVGWHLNSVVY